MGLILQNQYKKDEGFDESLDAYIELDCGRLFCEIV